NYLTLLFREKLSNKEGVVASALLDGTRDIERVGDHARDMLVSVNYFIKKDIKFSETAQKEVDYMRDLVLKMIDLTIESLEKEDNIIGHEALKICDEMYALEKSTRKEHTRRMKDGECEISAGVVYLDLTNHFVRACEHLRNILEKKLSGVL
ncbi:Na/Pi cotransporter family protein, partial [Gemelliphila palaticanis]